MEDLLKTIPPTLYNAETEELVYFTLTTSVDGKLWTAGYIAEDGLLFDKFYYESSEPLVAVEGVVLKLKQHQELLILR